MSRNWGISALAGIPKEKIEVIKGKVPSKSNLNKVGNGRWFRDEKVSRYESSFFYQCRKYRNAGIKGWFELYIDVFYDANRQDLDNAFKVILDCLQKVGAIKNDNKCVRINSEKRFSKEPRIEFAIIERKK